MPAGRGRPGFLTSTDEPSGPKADSPSWADVEDTPTGKSVVKLFQYGDVRENNENGENDGPELQSQLGRGLLRQALAPAPPSPVKEVTNENSGDGATDGGDFGKELLKAALGTEDLPVKNTFIHFQDGGGNDEQPTLGGYGRSITSPAEMQHPKIQRGGWAPSMAGSTIPESDAGRDSAYDMGGSTPSAAMKMPLKDPQGRPLASIGSLGHYEGNCRPCAWIHKTSGCSNEHNCTFCHMCDEEELKKRKKDKIARLKAEKIAAEGPGVSNAAPQVALQPQSTQVVVVQPQVAGMQPSQPYIYLS